MVTLRQIIKPKGDINYGKREKEYLEEKMAGFLGAAVMGLIPMQARIQISEGQMSILCLLL